MELQGDRVHLREDFVNLVEPQVTGRANVSEFAHTVAKEDTKQNGAEVKIKHPAFLQTRNKLRLLERRRRRKLRRWMCLDKKLGD